MSVQMRTILDVADNSGARKLQVILPLGGGLGKKAGTVQSRLTLRRVIDPLLIGGHHRSAGPQHRGEVAGNRRVVVGRRHGRRSQAKANGQGEHHSPRHSLVCPLLRDLYISAQRNKQHIVTGKFGRMDGIKPVPFMTLPRSMAETRGSARFPLVSGGITAYVCAAPYPKSGSYANS